MQKKLACECYELWHKTARSVHHTFLQLHILAQAFQACCLRKVLGIPHSYISHVTNASVLGQARSVEAWSFEIHPRSAGAAVPDRCGRARCINTLCMHVYKEVSIGQRSLPCRQASGGAQRESTADLASSLPLLMCASHSRFLFPPPPSLPPLLRLLPPASSEDYPAGVLDARFLSCVLGVNL